MAAGGARSFCVAVCVVLFLASERYVLARRNSQALLWEIFNNEVTLTARATVSQSAIDIDAAGMKHELAEDVFASIEANVEPSSGFSMMSFGVYFAVVIWSAGIPPDLQGIFTLGEEAVIASQPAVRLAKKGAATLEACPRGAMVQSRPLGAFGSPCSTGASLLIEQTTPAGAAVNCLVMYTYRKLGIFPDSMLSMFNEALAATEEAEPRLRSLNPDFGAIINLTRAICTFFRAVRAKCRTDFVRKKVFAGAVFILSAVAVGAGEVSNNVGVACPNGGLILKKVPVALSGINLNLPPEVYLYAIAIGPFP